MSDELTVRDSNPQEMITLAIEKGADPAFLSRLLDVQERWQANVAKRAYVAAMTAFKQEAPAVLKKADSVNFETQKGRTNYKYANLGSIVQEISAILGKHELSSSWETAQEGNSVTVTCHVTHVLGHRESVKLTGPADVSGNKNAIQAVGSTVTYLQRYTLLAALGLATGEDDDGSQGVPNGKPPVTMPTEKGAPADEGPVISEAQAKRLYAIAKGKQYTDEGIKALLEEHGYKSSKDIPKSKYQAICDEIESGKVAKVAEVVNEDGDPGATE